MKQISSRRNFLKIAGVGAGSMALGGSAAADDNQLIGSSGVVSNIARPSKVQKQWQDMELGMFFHFDIPIYKPQWKWRSFKDLPESNLYQPTKLDTDQWMEAAKAFGAKYAVFTAKHRSGFLQWQSDVHRYGVKQTSWRNGKGDVVHDFVESCHKYGIKPGLYASVHKNVHYGVNNGLVNRGKGGDDAKQAEYQRSCEKMLTELWSRYGDLFEIWFDGGALPVAEGGPDLMPIFNEYQKESIVFQGPAANIRWIGNENGVAKYPCWATVPRRNDLKGLRSGDPEGKIWMPGECDVPVRNHDWFWEPNSEHKLYSVDQLMDKYYKSVGRNCNLLLNANPGPDGLVPEADFKRYVEFGDEIRRRFDKPVAKLNHRKGIHVELKLKRSSVINHVSIMEVIDGGERVREYVVEGLVGGDKWIKLCDGISVGHKRIQQFDPVEVGAVRLRITKSVAKPVIRELAIYNCIPSNPAR